MAQTFISRAGASLAGTQELGSGVEEASAGIARTLSPPSGHWLPTLLRLGRVCKGTGKGRPVVSSFGFFGSPALPS